MPSTVPCDSLAWRVKAAWPRCEGLLWLKAGGVTLAKIARPILAWRRRQTPGAIMRPTTFRRIVRRASAAGYRNPRAVAGRAYWNTVRAKARRLGRIGR